MLVCTTTCGCTSNEPPASEFHTYNQQTTRSGVQTSPALTMESPADEDSNQSSVESSGAPATEPRGTPSTGDEGVPSGTDATTPGESAQTGALDETELIYAVSALAPLNVVDSANVSEVLRALPPPVAATDSRADPAGTAGTSATTPVIREVKLLVPEQTFRVEGPEGALRINFDDLDLLKVLNMEPVTTNAVELMPEWLKQLDGKRIRLRGYMIPTFESTGLTSFVLARDTQLCCMGRNPKVYDVIQVELRPGRECDYLHLRPFDVVGTLKIELLEEEGTLLGLYWISDAFLIER